jgi:hypothetical protein
MSGPVIRTKGARFGNLPLPGPNLSLAVSTESGDSFPFASATFVEVH